MSSEPGTKDRIMVVDDDPDSLRFILDTLEDAGMLAIVATSGGAAIDLLAHSKPDLILMDALMPGLTGFETTERIKSDPAMAHVPVIFMTGLTAAEHAVTALKTGGVDYVRKPIVVEELLARMRVHLANARASHRSRLALDVAGRRIVALDMQAAVLWCTPQAGALLAQIDPDWSEEAQHLPLPLYEAARRMLREPARPGTTVCTTIGDRDIEMAPIRGERPDELLIRIREVREGADIAYFQQQTELTQREAEVLLWISHGKSNRTISEILGISPRTVNKHLQQIFNKLGVETRAAAAGVAVRMMAN